MKTEARGSIPARFCRRSSRFEAEHVAKMCGHWQRCPGRTQCQSLKYQDEAPISAQPTAHLGAVGRARLGSIAGDRRGDPHNRAQGRHRRLPAQHTRSQAFARNQATKASCRKSSAAKRRVARRHIPRATSPPTPANSRLLPTAAWVRDRAKTALQSRW